MTELHEESVTVLFDGSSQPTHLKRFEFTVFDGVKNKVVASRLQFPVLLAYALTVHRAQGMTFQSVLVDCAHMIRPGQIGVAVGRVTSKAGLTLKNYTKSLVKPQPKEVANFYDSLATTLSLEEDMSCCQSFSITPPSTPEQQQAAPRVEVEWEFSVSTDDSEAEEDVAQSLIQLDTLTLSHLATITYSNPQTANSKSVNDCISYICDISNRAARVKFISKIWIMLSSLFTCHLSENPANKDITLYYQKIQQYLASHEYNIRVAQLYSNNTETPSSQKRVAYAIIEQLRVELLSQKTANLRHLSEAHIELAQVNTDYDDHNISSIRHIGGWSLSKLMKYKKKAALRNMYNEKLKEETLSLKADMEILENLTTVERDTSDKTAVETIRKEYVSGALKLPTASMTQLLVLLDAKLVAFEKSDVCKSKGGDMYTYILQQLYDDEELSSQWRNVSGSDNLLLFHSIIDKYTILSANHFIRRTKDAMKTTKKKAHRTQQEIPSKRSKK